ncbi:MAG: T9SS type A sorting domain-containing protein [Chitinophagales bacterium]|nr:T9SS type A sorting domain-containing protein [Chitinophagales bacterium]
MKKVLFTIAVICSLSAAQAQTAPDFTASDCSSASHSLYTELAAGKTVVITWVMPCGSCVNGGKAAQNAVASYNTSNPGKVVYWMIDDLGDTPCPSLSSWASSNGITLPTLFGNSGNAADENDFGGTGMPHVVVIAPDKTILFNKKNGAANDETGIKAAISQSIALNVAEIDARKISIAPNPASNQIRVSYDKAIATIRIVTPMGQTAAEYNYSDRKLNPSIDISALATGIYKVLITDIDGKRGVAQIVKQ